MKFFTSPKVWILGFLMLFASQVFSQNTITLQPCVNGKDAYIRSVPATGNYGNADALAAATLGAPSNTTYRSFLEFDLSSIAVGSVILSAQLNLVSYAGTGHIGTANATDLRIVDNAWDENTISWNNQPGATTVFTVLPQSTNTTQNYQVDLTSLVQDWVDGTITNHGMSLQLTNEIPENYLTFFSGDSNDPDLCPELIINISDGEPIICEQDFLNISTGFDNASNSEQNNGTQDSDWLLTIVPQNAQGATPGTDAYVIAPNAAWDDFSAAQWVSAYPFANYSEDNEDGSPYRFTNCFCLEDSVSLSYNMDVMVDNNITIGLQESTGTYHFIGDILLNATSTFQLPGENFNGVIDLPAGKHCLLADLRNISGVAMGFSIEGTLSNGIIGEGDCCGPTAIISGVKFEDINCNGEYDFEPGASDNDQYLPNWTIELYDASGGLAQSVQTDQFGYYQFVGVPPGTYTVSEVQQVGYSQSLPTAGNYTIVVSGQIDEVFNNIDFGNCPVNCGAVVNDSISVSCALDGTYEYYFSLDNLTLYNVTSVVFQAGSEFTFPNNNPYWAVSIPPNGNSGPFPGPVIIDPGFVITQPTEFCFDVIYLSDNYMCCHFEHCITLLPQDPCDDISVEVLEIVDLEDGCCYESVITNDFCEDYFVSITTEILTPGVTFANSNGSGNWIVAGTDTELTWFPNSGPTIPLGSTNGMVFCLEGINSISQTPQQVVYHWEALNAAGEIERVCSDTLEFFCQPCLAVSEESIFCNPDGTATFNFVVANNTDPAHPSGQIVLEIIDPFGLPLSQNVWNQPLASGQSSPLLSTTILNPLPPAGTIMQYKVVLYDLNGDDPLWCCHADTFSIVIPDCGQMGELCIDPSIIDTTAFCTSEFDPVCGCDNVTYTNACVAELFNGVTSWVPGECGPEGPEELVFEVSQTSPGIAELNWIIDNTSGVVAYVIERSLDPGVWNVLGQLDAVPGQEGYALLDDTAPEGLVYYKIRAMLIDGSVLMSNVVGILIEGPLTEPAILLAPNPVSEIFNFAWTNLPDSNFEMKIMNWGQVVYSQTINGYQGVIQLDATNWSPGVYQVIIYNEKGFQLKDKLVKVKR